MPLRKLTKSYVYLILFYAGNKLQQLQKKLLDGLLSKQYPLKEQVHFQLKCDIPSLTRNARKVVSRKDFSSCVCQKPDVADGIQYTSLVDKLSPGSIEARIRLAIVGQTQVGKTLLLKKILHDVRDNYDYIFYVPLDNVNFEDEMNILEFLTNQSTLEFITWRSVGDFQLFKQVVARLNGPQAKVCIVFDDLEKSSFNFADYRYKKSMFETLKAGFILSNILRTWLSSSHKILLSNPFNFFRLNSTLGFDFFEMVYIQGCIRNGLKQLTTEQKIELGCNQKPKCKLKDECLGSVFNNCKDRNCSVCSNCFDENCHQEIYSLFQNHCNNTELIKLTQNLKSFQNPSSIAVACRFLAQKVGRIFSYYNSKTENRCFFERIGRFAWIHYEKKEFFFSAAYLKKFGLSNTEIDIFFICSQNQSTHSLHNKDLLFCFYHVMLHEFLAALFLLSQPFKNLKLSPNPHKSFLQGFTVIREFVLEMIEPTFIENLQDYQFCDVYHNNSTKILGYFGK